MNTRLIFLVTGLHTRGPESFTKVTNSADDAAESVEQVKGHRLESREFPSPLPFPALIPAAEIIPSFDVVDVTKVSPEKRSEVTVVFDVEDGTKIRGEEAFRESSALCRKLTKYC
jgi:hypothetical protein